MRDVMLRMEPATIAIVLILLAVFGTAAQRNDEAKRRDAIDQYFAANPHREEWRQVVIDEKFGTGMLAEELRLSIGPPRSINRTVGAWGSREQWVYRSNNYIYLENGVVTGWQN